MECEHTLTLMAHAVAKGDPSMLDREAHLHLEQCKRCQKELDRMVTNGVVLSLLRQSDISKEKVEAMTRDIVARIRKLPERQLTVPRISPKAWSPRSKKKEKPQS